MRTRENFFGHLTIVLTMRKDFSSKALSVVRGVDPFIETISIIFSPLNSNPPDNPS